MIPLHLVLAAALAADPAPRPPNSLTDDERRQGWVLLFDGQDTRHFRAFRSDRFPATGWQVIDGALCRTGPGAGDIITNDQFADFEFVCEWRVAPGGNSGIIYRCTEERPNTWETGPEMQILDDAAHGDAARPETRAGAMYDLFPCAQNAVRPAGQWNEARVIARGPRIEHWLNGVKVVDANLESDEYAAAKARSKWASMPLFASRPRGHIALQDHGDEVCFRNIRVRRLD